MITFSEYRCLPCPNTRCQSNVMVDDSGSPRYPFTPFVSAQSYRLTSFAVCCEKCSVQGPNEPTEEKAAAAWNALPRTGE